MSTAAQQASQVFSDTGRTWRDRPVQPPPYIPSQADIDGLWAELLAQVLAPNGPSVAGKRNLRVRTIRPPAQPRPPEGEEPPPPLPTLYAFEVESQAAGDTVTYQTMKVVDADGVEQ